MKLAVFSDLHAHTFKDFDGKSDLTGSNRLDRIVSTLMFIRDDCVERGIEHILFAGDMFHIRSKVDTVVFNAIYDTIKTFNGKGIGITAIAGNHDQYDNSDVPKHSLHAFNDLQGVNVFDDLHKHFMEDADGYSDILIHCVPYSKNAQRTKDWIDKNARNKGENIHICMFHLGIDGGFVGKGSYPMADAFKVEDLKPEFYDYIVGGHFHKHQFLGGHPHVFYTGAPIQHSFSDEGENKGYFIIDTNTKNSVQFVHIPNPEFLTMSATDILNEDMCAIADAGHYVRLHVTEKDLQLAVSHCPPHLHYKVVLEKEYQAVTRVDVKIGMNEEEIVKKYAEEYNPSALEIGLKILSEVKGGS